MTLSPSKLERRYETSTLVANNTQEISKVNSEIINIGGEAKTLPTIKKALLSPPQTVRGIKDTNASNTLKEAAKHLLNSSTVIPPPYLDGNVTDPLRRTRTNLFTTEEDPLPKRKELADIDGASMLSENEWAEIINYQRELDEEKMRKEREQREAQKRRVRGDLEQQLKEKRERVIQEKEAKDKYEA